MEEGEGRNVPISPAYRRRSPGAKIGAIVGFLIWCTVDFIFYGSTNMMNRPGRWWNLEIVHGGHGCAAIGAVLRQTPTPTEAAA